MNTREPGYEELLGRLEQRERAGRRTALVWTLVPALLALAFLGYSGWQLTTASEQVATLEEQAATLEEQATALRAERTQLAAQADDLRAQSQELHREAEARGQHIERLETEIGDLHRQLGEAEQRLQQTLDLDRFRHPVDFVDLKVIFSRHPKEARRLEMIMSLRERGVRWRLGGQTIDEGFDSPGFAAFVLQESGLPSGFDWDAHGLIPASRELYALLRATDGPRVGDLVFYPAGYALFYFLDQDNKPFVIGMTPQGIVALNPDFSEPVGYRRTELGN